MLLRSSYSIVLINAALLSTPAISEERPWYIGFKGGVTQFDDACESAATSCDDSDYGYGIFSGYQFHKNFAVEIGYSDLGEASARYPSRPGSEFKGELSLLDLSLRAHWPVFKAINLYGKAGATWENTKVTADNGGGSNEDDDINALFATGLEYSWTDAWLIQAEIQYVDGIGNSELGEADSYFISAGARFRWGY